MSKSLITGAICLLFAGVFGVSPAVADPLPSEWQAKRNAGNHLTDKVCKGSNAATREFWTKVSEGDPVLMNNVNWLRSNCGLSEVIAGEDAWEYMRKSADLGYPIAQKNLGLEMLTSGKYGVGKNPERGAELMEAAARGGYGVAAVELAEFYIDGDVLPRDIAKARELFEIAQRENMKGDQFRIVRAKLNRIAKKEAESGATVTQASASAGTGRDDAAAEKVFAELKEQFGEGFEAGTGYLEKAGVYYFHHCSATSFGKLAVFRLQGNGEAQVWSDEKACVNGVDETDLNGDGEPEIRYYTQGGGSGTYTAMVNFLHWPEGEPEPKKGLEYTTYSYSWWDGLYSKYGYDDGVASLLVTTTGELVEGPSCKWGEYCPSWPTDAECRAAIRCPMVVEKSLYVGGEDEPYPDELRGDRAWERFVQDVYEGTGYRLANKGAPEGIVSASLSPLEKVLDAAEGEMPGEVSEARKDLISDWLN